MADTAKDVPKGTTVVLLGQVQTMNSAFSGLLFGLLGAIVLIYLLIVVNFQSWSDPFVIITALPAALAGIVWMLFATQTTLSVPALTGAIMCMGVATANSVLVISFARERYEDSAIRRSGAGGRLRPLPPGADDGAGDDHRHGADGAWPGRGRRAERAARPRRGRRPDFRNLATLMFVPVVFSMVHKKQAPKPPRSSETVHADETAPAVSPRKLRLFGIVGADWRAAVVVDRHQCAPTPMRKLRNGPTRRRFRRSPSRCPSAKR